MQRDFMAHVLERSSSKTGAYTLKVLARQALVVFDDVRGRTLFTSLSCPCNYPDEKGPLTENPRRARAVVTLRAESLRERNCLPTSDERVN